MKSPKTEPLWKIIDHTADIRVEVYGNDLKQLFVNAAVALTKLLRVRAPAAAEQQVDISLESTALDELLVDWLREILFYHQARGWILVKASIDQLSETSLQAAVLFGVRSSEQEPDFEIKAVTYHGLSVEKNDRGYRAKILFDV